MRTLSTILISMVIFSFSAATCQAANAVVVIPLKGTATCNGVPCQPVQDSNGIFVSKVSGADTAFCGTRENECASILMGIVRAQAQGRTNVYVADGVYDETIIMADGINLLGGYNHLTWTRHLENTLAIIEGIDDNATHKKTVTADTITLPTVFEGFVVFGASNAVVHGNSYAVWVKDSTENLSIKNNRIFAGRGGNGMPAASGVNGAYGVDGGAGADGITTTNPLLLPGGSGGHLVCGGTEVSGGNGGGLLAPFDYDEQNQAGENGSGSAPGTGGTGGTNGRLDNNDNICTMPTGGVADGWEGADGMDGNIGFAGSGCTNAAGNVVDSEWTANIASNGQNGTSGSGGGGGGSGGCAGTGGAGGQAGGGSFGIFVTYSFSPVSFPEIEGNAVYLGTGGNGANGGQGGIGGIPGGAGGNAGMENFFCSGEGGKGGKGGRGGHGGGGGGACGGVSFGLYYHGSDTPPTWNSMNSFTLSGAAGKGGKGGSSAGNSGTDGVDGSHGGSNLL